MKKSFVNNSKPYFIFTIVSFVCFLGYSLFGIDDIYCSYGFASDGTVVKYAYQNLYDGWLLGPIFVPVLAVLLVAIIPLTFLAFQEDRKNEFLLKIIYSAIAFCIFGTAFAQLLIISLEGMIINSGSFVIVLLVHLIICSLLMFIFSLLRFKSKYSTQTEENKQVNKKVEKENFNDATNKLLELKKLYDLGVISEEEYNEKKKKYIDCL